MSPQQFLLIPVLVLFINSNIYGQKSDFPNQQFDSLNSKALELIASHNYYEALQIAEELRVYAEKDSNLVYIAFAEDLFRGAYTDLFAYNRAEEHLLKGIKHINKLKNPNILSIAYANLAHLHMLADNFEASAENLKVARKLNKDNKYNTKNYNFETELMLLYKKEDYESLVKAAKFALSELMNEIEQAKKDPTYDTKHWLVLIHKRLRITFELYLAFGLFEINKETEYANSLLNRIKDKKLEEILYMSDRVYQNYFRLNSYKKKYFLDQPAKNIDSINHYKLQSKKYFDKTVQFLTDATSRNQLFLKNALESEKKITELDIMAVHEKSANTWSFMINFMLGALGLMTIGTIAYYVSKSKKLKKISQKLKKSHSDLRNMYESRDKFLGVVSREIKEPLYSMQELISILPNSVEKEENKEIHLAGYSLVNLRHAVDNAYEFSIFNSLYLNKELKMREIDFGELLLDIELYFHPVFTINNITWKTALNCKNDIFELPRSKFILVLNNLIKNAVDKEDVKSVTITIDEKIINETDSKIRCQVTDDGQHISDEMLAYINSGEIYIEDENTNSGFKLGLILCNQVLNLLGTQLEFIRESENNTVAFELTLKRVLQQKETTFDEAFAIYNKNILFIDDNLVNLNLTKILINSLGHECDTANSGQMALQKIMSYTYDLVLIDISTDILQEFNITSEIKKYDKDLPIVAYTAFNEDEILERCRELEIIEVINKPLSTYEFKKVIKKL